MNSTVIGRGALAGMAGGMVMAMWSMVVLAATGKGFWAPVNLIAHLVWRDAPLSGGFSGGALALGLLIHMATSMMLGVAIALVADRARAGRLAATALGMTAGLAVWLVNQDGIWHAIDSAAAHRFTPWVFALGHLMFGVVAGAAAVTGARTHTRTSTTRPAHTATGRPVTH